MLVKYTVNYCQGTIEYVDISLDVYDEDKLLYTEVIKNVYVLKVQEVLEEAYNKIKAGGKEKRVGS